MMLGTRIMSAAFVGTFGNGSVPVNVYAFGISLIFVFAAGASIMAGLRARAFFATLIASSEANFGVVLDKITSLCLCLSNRFDGYGL